MVSLPISTTAYLVPRNDHLVWGFGKLLTAQHLTLSLPHVPKWYERSLQSTIECHQQDALKQFINSSSLASHEAKTLRYRLFIKIVFNKLGGPACGRLSYFLETLRRSNSKKRILRFYP
jgi:hypothetical protein